MAKLSPQAKHIKCLEWAILLCQANLDECTEGDWLNWKDGLYNFLEQLVLVGVPKKRLEYGIQPTKEKYIKEVTADHIKEIRNSLMAWIKSLASNDFVYSLELRNNTKLIFTIDSDFRQFFQVIAAGDYVLNAKIAMGSHLVGSGIRLEQIRACPECQIPFILKRKPRPDRNFYCSLRCSRNAATKAYRERNKDSLREKEKKRNRDRYLTKQQKKYGQKVNVAKKPRKQR